MRLLVPFLCVSVTGFQSTHPRGVRHVFLEEFKGSLKFQSTHPRGVRLTRLRRPCFRRYFNPRTHVGCDVIRRQFGLEFLRISIHAPTWGATRPFYRPCRCCGISIHAPTWGATGLRHNGLQPARISIHAPTWGATLCLCPEAFFRQDFNPRTHVGCDTVRMW